MAIPISPISPIASHVPLHPSRKVPQLRELRGPPARCRLRPRQRLEGLRQVPEAAAGRLERWSTQVP